MRARKVRGLDRSKPLGRNARKIVRVCVDELYSFAERARDPSQSEALHDMRIAAKRLRYVLEVCEPAFGAAARTGVAEMRRLQDLLGEIHDCDVMLPRVLGALERLAEEDLAAVRGGPVGADGLRSPTPLRDAPNRARYRGLHALITHLRARREELHAQFLDTWQRLEREGFREELRTSLLPPKPATAV